MVSLLELRNDRMGPNEAKRTLIMRPGSKHSTAAILGPMIARLKMQRCILLGKSTKGRLSNSAQSFFLPANSGEDYGGLLPPASGNFSQFAAMSARMVELKNVLIISQFNSEYNIQLF